MFAKANLENNKPTKPIQKRIPFHTTTKTTTTKPLIPNKLG
jgi:hypothetical protein